MSSCAKGFIAIYISLIVSCSLMSDDSLTYGLETKNGEYIRKALTGMSQKEYTALFSEDIGEKIAFTYIQEACNNPLVLIRLEGLFGARNANNGASTLLLEKALDDPHATIRSYARRAAQGYFDSFIQQKLLQQASSKRGEERLEAFSCLARQDPDKALTLASTIFKNPETPVAEKLAIGEIVSSCSSYKQPEKYVALAKTLENPELLLWLASSNPTLLKEDMLLNGLKNSSLSCKLAALEYLGLWGFDQEPKKDEIHDFISEQLHSSNYILRAKTAWVALCHLPDLKDHANATLKALSITGEKEASLVSTILSRSGKAGLVCAMDLYKDMNVHTLVRLNAALQLIRYRTQLEQAPFELLETLQSTNRSLAWNEQSPGNAVLFGDSEEDPLSHQLAQYKDASVRCSLLGLALNTSNSSDVEQLSYKMAEQILKKKEWGPLLEGGSELFFQVGPKSIALARKLSGSLYEEVRIQAAGILAAMHCEKEALEILKQEFIVATFDGKMAILALLSPFTMEEALPFLTTAMKDKSTLLRVRAAGVFLFMKYAKT